MIVQTEKVRLYPNKTMQRELDKLCDYRRFCWNKGLEIWNDMYDAFLITGNKTERPSAYKVRDEMVEQKADWQFGLSSRCLQLAISDLGKAWSSFLNKAMPDWGRPRFKSKRSSRQGFKSDMARIQNGKLRLEKPQGCHRPWYAIRIKGARSLEGKLGVVSIYRECGQYWATLPFKRKCSIKPSAVTAKTAVDINCGHYDYTGGRVSTLPKRLDQTYQQIKHYQRLLARKRNVNGKQAVKSKNYMKTRNKLQRAYQKAAAIQHDIVQKFTAKLVRNYNTIVIEDLDVKHMQMSHVASKGLHRAQFGYFRQVLTYKCEWYGRKLILADRYYPSTQRCSKCGHVKTGDDKITLWGNKKHHTKHNEYICYECGAKMDRDHNAVMNLLALA